MSTDKNKTVGKCTCCNDPIYAFQLVRDNKHDGCSRLKWDRKTQEWK